MAQYTFQTRRKLTEDWVRRLKEKGGGLSGREKRLLPGMAVCAVPQAECRWMGELLSGKKYGTLSKIYQKEIPGLVELCVPKELLQEFYDALDSMNQFQMTAGWSRRSVRSSSYEPFTAASVRLLWAYARLKFYGGSLEAVLLGQIAPELYDHARTESWDYAAMLAARIDRGCGETMEAVREILTGENNTMMISHELIRGIVMSRSRELYQLLGGFLLAARLQEGVRQAVCETMDAGRPEAFLHLFQVIEDNNLVRYSSVKRAVSTWIGIFDENSVDRITDKLVRLMGSCLREPEFCEAQLASNDSVAISCALWAKGFYDAGEAIEAVRRLIKNGTKNQKMTASYFNRSLQYPELKMEAAKEVILTQSGDRELAACFMSSFMDNVHIWFYNLVKREKGSAYFSLRDGAVNKPQIWPVTDFFSSREEAWQVYQRLKEILEDVPRKGVDLFPCIFPWYRVTMTQSDLIARLCFVAWLLQDEACLDEAAVLLPRIGLGESCGAATRAAAARVLLYRPVSAVRKRVLFELLHNPEEFTMRSAFLLVEDMTLFAEDYRELEKNLKYKKGRMETLSLLKKQDRASLRGSIGRLLGAKSEECHMGALDLALQLKKEDPKGFREVKPLLAALSEPTGREKVLLEELTGSGSKAQDLLAQEGYGLYDPSVEWAIPAVEADAKEASALFQCGEGECIRILKSLNRLVEENRELEYETVWGEEALLGAGLEQSRWLQGDPGEAPLDQYPFRPLWEQFYEEEIRTPQMLLELHLYQQCRSGRSDYEKNIKLYKKVFGSGLVKKPPFKELVQGLRYGMQARTVLSALFDQYVPDSMKSRWALVGLAGLLGAAGDSDLLFEAAEKRPGGERAVYTKRAAELPIFAQLVSWLDCADRAEWGTAFALRFHLEERFRRVWSREKFLYGSTRRTAYLRLSDLVQCCVRGFWNKDMFYKAVFRFLGVGSLLGPVSAVEQRGAVSQRDARPAELTAFFGPGALTPEEGRYHFDGPAEDLPAMKLAHELYREIVPVVLEVELSRGEQETPFSRDISSIHVVYGSEIMVRILVALGQDTLIRNSYYSSGAGDRKSVLSHLLKVCRPLPGETAEDLRRALLGTEIAGKRLAELSMYAQQWIPLIEEYLELPGFQSGCYYFMAHTSESMDEYTTSVVAKYTPLSPEELREGAFDIKWFFEAYGKLGEKNFKLLYDAAKYSSGGAAHARARKYADAALGKVSEDKLESEISAKRGKDLLMSLGLLPLCGEEQDREGQLLSRYQFIQNFKKESRQFGAQRRASEGRAVELALKNLSVNAGFSDVTRLTLRMESRLAESLDGYFAWRELDEGIELSIQVDECGKSRLLCRRKGKISETIPASYKKSGQVKEYQKVVKQLKEQYSRTRQMMEQAMEDRTVFQGWELLELLKNPVVRPIVSALVVQECGSGGGGGRLGFLTEDGLVDGSGQAAPAAPSGEVRIAHPFDLYQAGCWHDYQRYLFERQLRQPFKQVFRELYVKLQEELSREHSLLFAGNQIQPQKTVGALKSRRWVADYEDGLQKIYYKENIIAQIYAMADWFSPSDVEAPTLEGVAFLDRKSFKRLKISEIPDVIYSEVMRDVDLAVSVAHAGGVDPETSHSTVEMRSAIVACNLELFKIKNVKLEGNHAVIDGKLGQYTVHLGSGVVHQMGNAMLYVVPVHSQHRGRIFLPFVDDDPKTAEIMSKILLFAEDTKIKDPSILSQIR